MLIPSIEGERTWLRPKPTLATVLPAMPSLPLAAQDAPPAFLRQERREHSLQPTDLVHETYLRLLGPDAVACQDRAHFFRLAASAMRRILVDHARAKNAEKRSGGASRVPLGDFLSDVELPTDQILDLDAALTRLALLDERQVKIVEMRFFGGLSEDEIADALDLSTRTVKREWAMAKAWLFDELRA